MKKRITAVLLTLVIALSFAIPASAAAKPKSITITGKTTVKVGKKIELDTRISPFKAKVRDSKIVWSSSNPAVAKVMDKTDEDTKIKGIKAGTATITVKIKGTKIKDTHKVTVKKAKTTTSTTSSDKTKIKNCKTKAKNLKKEIKNTKLASKRDARLKQFRKLEGKIDKIEYDLDKIENKWELKFETGKASRSAYRSIEMEVEKVEEYLDTVENYLEQKFNYEFDW